MDQYLEPVTEWLKRENELANRKYEAETAVVKYKRDILVGFTSRLLCASLWHIKQNLKVKKQGSEVHEVRSLQGLWHLVAKIKPSLREACDDFISMASVTESSWAHCTDPIGQ